MSWPQVSPAVQFGRKQFFRACESFFQVLMQREAGSHTYASLRPGFLHPIIPSYSTNPLLKHSSTHITKVLMFSFPTPSYQSTISAYHTNTPMLKPITLQLSTCSKIIWMVDQCKSPNSYVLHPTILNQSHPIPIPSSSAAQFQRTYPSILLFCNLDDHYKW